MPEAGGPELPAPVAVPGTGVLAVPMPCPGEAALGMLELPELGGLVTDPV